MVTTCELRPRRKEISSAPGGLSLADIAGRVRYVGSSEHKRFPSFAGPARRRSDATVCDPRLGDPTALTAWLQDAVRHGQVGAPWEGDYPRYAWYRQGDDLYEGRLVNRGLGEYKGYPITQAEWPAELD